MKKVKLAGMLFLAMLFLSDSAYSKWWIFGQTQDEVALRYLYVNNISCDENGSSLILYKTFLEDGLVLIRGKASVKKGRIGAVQISLDNRESWNKADLAKDGAFIYRFKPEPGKVYDMFVKVLDTGGKTNNVDETYKRISVSDEDIRSAVTQVLEKLVANYKNEDPVRFMENVSDDFAGDAVVLDRAVRKDFSIFDNIDLRFILNSVASDPKGRVFASINYNRMVVGTKDGKTYNDRGTTEFTFKSEGPGLKVSSMKNPLIFGLSDAANVATGTVVGADAENMLIVDNRGQIGVKPFMEAIEVIENEGDEAGPSGIPAPTNLRITDGAKHHYVGMEFDTEVPIDDLLSDYEVIVEEGRSPGGPWMEALTKPGDTYIQLTTDAIAQEAAILYYRVKLSKDGSSSKPSNVVMWDNN